ncbi:MAG: class I SAM-dependent RNA methyltransferase [Cellulomonadaceae bacterium]
MSQQTMLPDPTIELEVGAVAHGGHCVARYEGRVVFVRHALPEERVRARLTEAGPEARFWRADAVEVLEASPDRVPSVWPAAGPGGVGGGELAHVALPAQREWKAAVVSEQLRHLAGVEPSVVVEAAPGDPERGGLGWRTRIGLVAGADGRAGMRGHRSHDVHALADMPLATAEVAAACAREKVFTRRWRPGTTIDVVAPACGSTPVVLVDGRPWRGGRPDDRPNARRTVVESVRVGETEHRFRVAADGFWQVHRAAPAVLAQAVLSAAGDVGGAHVLDMFAGAGLFSVPLADAVGPDGRVQAVEADARSVKDARRALHEAPQVALHTGDVARVLAELTPRADVVVLDPPRAGAGPAVMSQLAATGASRLVYVACDPAALARDVAAAGEHDYTLTGLRAFDLFPMTHHVECVAVLERKGPDKGRTV